MCHGERTERAFNHKVVLILVGDAENFAISGARTIDNYTISPSVFLMTDSEGQIANRLWNGEFYPNLYQNRTPSRGIVQLIDAADVSALSYTQI